MFFVLLGGMVAKHSPAWTYETTPLSGEHKNCAVELIRVNLCKPVSQEE